MGFTEDYLYKLYLCCKFCLKKHKDKGCANSECIIICPKKESEKENEENN